jgi:hypothetical protein
MLLRIVLCDCAILQSGVFCIVLMRQIEA